MLIYSVVSINQHEKITAYTTDYNFLKKKNLLSKKTPFLHTVGTHSPTKLDIDSLNFEKYTYISIIK